MSSLPKYSIVVPVYNRPDEVEELLASLTSQSLTNFEVLIVEDGSTITCKEVFEKYTSQLNIRYFYKPNTGPGPSRNFGYQQARGDYFIVFDSDCIIPADYLKHVDDYLNKNTLDAWGGPDRGHENFTPIQQAMAYTMSSVLTTGGIRGGTEKMNDFQPRSFNMGISRRVFETVGGFKFDRFAEDIEFSIRIMKSGFRIGLIADAFVFHKRRTNLKQFYNQVFNFGRGRVLVGRAHPGAIKLTHWFPAFFLSGLFVALLFMLLHLWAGLLLFVLYAMYGIAISFFALKATRSIKVGWLAAPSAFVQLCGYGAGFLSEIFSRSRQ